MTENRVLDFPVGIQASSSPKALPRRFLLRVINENIVNTDADCLVVNHYAGAQIAGAAADVNVLTNDAILHAAARGELDSPLGHITFIPARRAPMIADVVAVLSMGEYEMFTKQDLNLEGTEESIAAAVRKFGRGMATVCCDAEQRDVATVAHGAGDTSQIPPQVVARHLVTGYWQGLQQSGKSGQSYTLTLVEKDASKCSQLVAGIQQANQEDLDDVLQLHRAGFWGDPANGDNLEAGPGYAWIGDLDPSPASDLDLPPHHMRLGAFMLDDSHMKLTIFGNSGADQAIKDDFQANLVEDMRERLRAFNALAPKRLAQLKKIEGGADADAAAEAKNQRLQLNFEVELRVRSIGAVLYNQILNPNTAGGIREQLARPDAQNLLLRLDESTVSIPWELMSDEEDLFCLSREIGRQMELPAMVRTYLTPNSHQDQVLRILLVSNPTGDLENAEREAQRIVDRLQRYSKVKVEVTHLSGDRATPLAVISRADENGYDVFHFAGHATFDPSQPTRTGLVMAGGEILTVESISRITTPPRLIFFNACESAGTYQTPARQIPEMRALGLLEGASAGVAAAGNGSKGKGSVGKEGEETNRNPEQEGVVNRFFGHLPVGTVSALLRSGITNFIGATWPVEDAAAAEFAVAFYARLAEGKTVGAAMRQARLQVIKKLGFGQLAWASYVLYGVPWSRVV